MPRHSKCEMPSDEETAYHESAHAVMALMMGVPVHRVEIYDRVTNGLSGCCTVTSSPNWERIVWVMLAGPAMDSIKYSESMYFRFTSTGCQDFDMAFDAVQAALAPTPPQDIQEWIPSKPADIREMVQSIFEGWRPEGIHGQKKRKLTMYLKKYADTLDVVQTYIHQQAVLVRKSISENDVFKIFVPAVARCLIAERTLTEKDLVRICLEATQAAG